MSERKSAKNSNPATQAHIEGLRANIEAMLSDKLAHAELALALGDLHGSVLSFQRQFQRSRARGAPPGTREAAHGELVAGVELGHDAALLLDNTGAFLERLERRVEELAKRSELAGQSFGSHLTRAIERARQLAPSGATQAVRGVLVREADDFFVLPTASVERAVRVLHEQIKTEDNRDVVELDDHVVPLVSLSDILQLSEKERSAASGMQVLVLSSGSARAAFELDAVCMEDEFLVLPLGRELLQLAQLSGACVLGSGRLAPLLDPNELVRVALRLSEAGVIGSLAAEPDPPSQERRARVLLVSESGPARRVLKSALVGAGFSADSAADGLEALDRLDQVPFDLVVSDLDAPRLSGIGLLRRIRADPAMAHLPFTLIASEREADKCARAGADAWIARETFEPGAFVAVLRGQLASTPLGTSGD